MQSARLSACARAPSGFRSPCPASAESSRAASWSIPSAFQQQGVNVRVRIAIAVEFDQARWVAYGASDTPEHEAMATVRDIVPGRAATMWLEVQMPDHQPATIPAHIEPHSNPYDW